MPSDQHTAVHGGGAGTRAARPGWRRNRWVVLAVLCTGFFMILLDTTIVNIAVPSMIDGLHASLDQVLWVLNGYILAYAVLLITAGQMGDIWGQRNLFAAGLAIFTVASAVCGLAADPSHLIAARVVQGVGGALLTPQTLAILTSIFPPERRGAAFGVWGGVAGVAALAGPTLGGLLVTDVGWRWIFYVNVPIGAGALAATFLIVPDLRPGRAHRFDVPGVLLASAGLLAVTFALIEGQRYDWGTVWGPLGIWELLGAGLALLGVFLAVERRRRDPLLPLSLFRDRNFALMNWMAAAVTFGMLALFLPYTIYLQSVLGMTALAAGLTIAPMSVMSMVTAPAAGRLADRIGGKYILIAGLTLYAAGILWIDLVAGTASTWLTFLPPLLLGGVGMGATFAPLTTVAMRTMHPEMAGAASGILNTMRQLGGVIGSAVIGALLQNRLVTSLHDQAVSLSAGLPPLLRQAFVAAFSHVGTTGLQVGRGETGALTTVPPGVPPELAQQLQQLAHEVFANAFVDAMRVTVLVPVAVILVAAATGLLIRDESGRRRRTEL